MKPLQILHTLFILSLITLLVGCIPSQPAKSLDKTKKEESRTTELPTSTPTANPTPTQTPMASPTASPTPPPPPPPMCTPIPCPVIAPGCTVLTSPVYINGCLVSCGTFNCQSPQQSPTPTPLPTNSPTPTASPLPSPTVTPTPTPTPPVPPAATSGIWLNQTEIMKLPVTGSAFDRMKSAANSNWGSANLADNNAEHDVLTLAGALYAVRMQDANMRNKVVSALQSAMGSGFARVLEMSRGFQTYIIAADLIGYRDPAFVSWVRSLITKPLQGHSGGNNLKETALFSANNWGGHARASTIAAALYLNDSALLTEMVNVHLEFIGAQTPKKTLDFSDTDWHADPNNKAGVNRKGASRSGINIDGAIPEDMRRGGGLKSDPTYTGYGWEAMQGFTVSAIMLHRAGKVALNTGDFALKRAFEYLYRIGWEAESDDTWQPWLANYYFGLSLPTSAASNGKNMGYTDWTHGR